MSGRTETEKQVRAVIESWAQATRENRLDDVLKHHAADLVIFDVLPPMKYDSVESYRRNWEDWQPQTEGEMRFDLENVSITAGVDVAFAHAFIHCGGTTRDGVSFHDIVRATFCLQKIDGSWMVLHQHVRNRLIRGGELQRDILSTRISNDARS
jgi:ketosteroid isomerase-like protein